VDHLYGRAFAILTAITRQLDHNGINLQMEEAVGIVERFIDRFADPKDPRNKAEADRIDNG